MFTHLPPPLGCPRCEGYLKRGYYPSDQKLLADSCLDRLTRHQPVSPRTLRKLLRVSQAPFWIFPVEPSTA